MIQIRIIDSDNAFDELKESWDSLFAVKSNPNPYISFVWMREWWRYFCKEKDLQIAVGVSGEDIVGIAPLFGDTAGLFGIGNPDVDMFEFLMKEGFEEAFVEALLSWLDQSRYQSLQLQDVPSVTQTYSLLHKAGSVVENTVNTPLIDYSDKIASNILCKKLSKRLGRIKNKSNITFSFESKYAELQEAIDCIIKHQQNRFEQRNIRSNFSEKNYSNFYDSLIKQMASNEMVKLMKMNADGESIGWQIMFYDQEVVFGYTASADYSYKNLSPGGILLNWGACSFVDSEMKVKVYNLGRGEHGYKMRLANSSYKNMRIVYSKNKLHNATQTVKAKARELVRSNKQLYSISKKIRKK